MPRDLSLALLLLIAWGIATLALGMSAPPVHLLLAGAATLFVRGWALTR